MAGNDVFLRQLTIHDVDLLVRASRDDDIIRWTRMPENLDRAAAIALATRWRRRVVDGWARQYVIARRAQEAPVGLASLILQDPADPRTAEVAYWLLPSGRHQGLATGALRLLLRWAFEHAAMRCAALYTLEGNGPSERVAQRCGFRLDRLMFVGAKQDAARMKRWELRVGG